jgi:hypothetical protein
MIWRGKMSKQQIYVDSNIQDLVRGLNEIQDVTTLQSCDGHGGPAWITFECPPSTAITLFKIAMKHQGIGMSKHSAGKQSLRTFFSIGLNPRWASKTILEMQTEILEDLENSGLRTEECQFEILSPLSVVERKAKWKPYFERAFALMTLDKFESIKNFIYQIWDKRRASYARFPNLSGNVESGDFYWIISYKRCLPRVSNPVKFHGVLWDVRWREYKMVMSFHESYHNNPFREGCFLEIRCLKDIEGIQFIDDDVTMLMKTLLQ